MIWQNRGCIIKGGKGVIDMLLGIDGGSIKPAVSHHSPSVHLSRPHPAASHPAASGSSGSYSVHSGDTLSGIASSQGLSLASLEKDNPQIKNPSLIFPGESIHLPGDTVSLSPSAAGHSQTNPSGSSGDSYTVHSGDTLSGIASSQGLSLASLEKDNPQIKNPNFILPGEQIHLLGGSSSGQQQPQSGGNHIIRPTVNRPVNPGLGPVGGPARGQFIPSASSNSQPVYNLIGYFVARPTSDAQFV